MAKSNASGVANTAITGAVIILAILLVPKVAKAAQSLATSKKKDQGPDTTLGRVPTAQSQQTPQSKSGSSGSGGPGVPSGGGGGGSRSLVPSVTTRQLQALGSPTTNRSTFGDGLLGGPLVVGPSVSTDELQSLGGGSNDYSLLSDPTVVGPSVDYADTSSSFGDLFTSFGDLFSGPEVVGPSVDPFDVPSDPNSFSFSDLLDWNQAVTQVPYDVPDYGGDAAINPRTGTFYGYGDNFDSIGGGYDGPDYGGDIGFLY